MIRRWVVVLVSVVLLAGCATNPSTGRQQLILFSPDQVAAMGVEAKPQLTREFGGEVASQPLRVYVREVGERLTAHVEPEFANVPWEFTVLDSEVINAFALPGGKVFITRGLLEKFESEAEVAGVLGHEIGHVTGRHIDERLSQAAVSQVGLEVLGLYTESQLIMLGSDVAVQTVMLQFGRKDEDEADWQGLKYMTAAGYDPAGMIDVLRVLMDARAGGRPPEFLSTHPYPENRLSRVRAIIATDYAFTKGNPQYKKHRSRFQQEAVPHLR